MATAVHTKVVTIANWTQADLDAQIALGNFPPGTVLNDIFLASDFNAAHTITLGAGENYVTNAEKTVIGNTSGTNTGDNATNTQYSGLVSNATHTGDAEGATALTVKRINGVALAGLATGILKNTTTTGVPSIAINADLPVMSATVGGATPTPPNNTTTFLRGDATWAVPPSGSGPTFLLSTIDFGATPTDTASVVITGLANMTTAAHINVFVQEDDTTVGLGGLENNAARHETLSLFAQCSATARVAATGYTAKIRLLCGKATGKYRIHSEYSV